jgi:hypothetical protein
MLVSKPPDGKAIQSWLVRRLAAEIKTKPERIDLDQSPEHYALDSVVVVQICADLGRWIQGRELPIDQWWGAPTLRAFCNSCIEEQAPETDRPAHFEGEGNVGSLGAPLQRLDAARPLFLLARVDQMVAPSERHVIATLPAEPELVALSYRQVDEATGQAKETVYYGGSYAQYIRAWTAPVTGEGETRYDLYVLNSGSRPVSVIVAALTTDPAFGAK